MEEIKKGIYWVGSIDWDIRNFHGYLTQEGTTYNAFLIVDEKVVLIDTVKEEHYDDMMFNISQIINPAKIDMVISNHVEMDHSGSLPRLMEVIPQAKILASKQGVKGLQRHYKKEWNFEAVKSGDSLNIGQYTLSFVNTPMVHWPDSMVTYIPEAKLLFSNDAFGQHLATPERFDDELGWSLIQKEAAKYYANIVMPFGKQVNKALTALSGLDIDVICPSHGLIWRKFIKEILSDYQQWANHESDNKAVIVYDSMWKSTRKIAYTLADGLSKVGVRVIIRNLKVSHISDILTDVLSCRLVLLGSPTLNNGMLPTMGEFMTYLKGLRPQNRIGFAFGSYGWGGQAVKELVSCIEDFGWDQPEKASSIEYIPDETELTEVLEKGKAIGKYLLSNSP